MSGLTVDSTGDAALEPLGQDEAIVDLRGRVVAALRARQQSGLIAAVAPLLDQQAWFLTQELGLDRTQADQVLQTQHAILEVLAARYDALDEAIVCSEIPFAEIDGNRRIVYANRAFGELVPHLDGRDFVALFGARAPHVEEALRAGGNASLRVDVTTGNVARPVRLEVGPLRDEDGKPGSYALLLDKTAEQSRLNALQDGVLQTDLEGRIRFANERAAQNLGYDVAELKGVALRAVLLPEIEGEPDPVPAWLASETGITDVIRLLLKDGRTVPARVTATPYIEGSNRTAGLLMIFARLDEDLARRELKRILLEEVDPQRIIEAALRTTGTVVPFDMASFGIYDDQCLFWRGLSIVPEPDFEWSTRWFPINPRTKEWLEKGQTWDNSLESWIQKHQPDADTDPVTQAVLDREFTSMLVLPIREVGGFRSAVSLLSKSRSYGAMDLRTLQNLGLEEILQAADAALERARARAQRTMKDELNQAQSARLLAERLAKGAVKTFGWSYVGVFRVDRENRKFALMAQEAAAPSLLVHPNVDADFPLAHPKGDARYTQDIEAGMLGECLKRKSVLVVNDVDRDEEAYGFIRTAPGQRSAMTVPLFLNGRIEMILDLESTERNSFVGPDRDAVRGLAADCEQIFAARWQEVIERALMNQIEQAAVIVDAGGTVSVMNGAAERLLGKALGQALESFGAREADKAILKRSGSELQARTDVRLSVSAGTDLPAAEVAAWAERTPLLDDYGYQLWLLTSLAGQSRASDWEYLDETVTAVAQQTRAPLMVADGLLQGAISLLHQPERIEEGAELLKQAANALLKADLTFERLSERLTVKQPPSDAPIRFDLRALLDREVDKLSRTDGASLRSKEVISVHDKTRSDVSDEATSDIDLQIMGWPARVAFAFRSALESLLLQRVTPNDQIVVTLELGAPGQVVVCMSTAKSSSIAAEAEAPIQAGRARARQLARTASDAIEAVVRQHGGTLTSNDDMVYEITLPLAGPEVAP